MKRLILTSVAIAAMGMCAGAQAIPQDAKMEAEIQKRLAGMTLAEKVGQMCELTVGVVKDYQHSTFYDLKLNQDALQQMIREHKVGSFLNVADVAITPEQWYNVVKPINDVSIKELDIPTIYGLDMNHGASYTLGATLMPQNINMAATFNRDLAHRGGEITAYETRACNVPWTYNPTVDLARTPLWPRFWENYGEDAYLATQMGVATVLGMQGNDPNNIDKYHIAANLKHFMGYGAPVSGKDRTHSQIGEPEMREKHFAPYVAAALDGHVLSIMVNSTNNNGIPFHANAKYLTKWMKEELNWDGLIVTDWADINNLYTREFVAKDKKDAIRIAINAGIDMTMDPYSTDFCGLLMELVNEGKVSMDRINDACARVLRMKYRLNLFREPNTKWTDYPLFGGEEFARSSRQAADESIVLLKNTDNILPLQKGKRILVTGPNANSMRCLNGGWTYTWQGHLTDTLSVSKQYNTILEAMQNEFGRENIVYEPGITYGVTDQWVASWGVENVGDFDKVVAAANDCDVILACIGETSYCETPGNIDDLTMSPNQEALVKRLYATGKPVVLVLNQGRPRIIADIVDDAKAIVNAGLPSNYGGDALAGLLSGKTNFSGKLPYTYPKHTGSLYTYDYKKGEVSATMAGAYNYEARVDVQWQFGDGLSYTTYAYSNLKCDKTQFTADDVLTFTVDVTNTGRVAGKESVLLFSSDIVATTSPDVRRLRQFAKVDLQPGQTKTVTLKVPATDLAFVNPMEQWVLEEGDFRIAVGDQSLTVTATETRTLPDKH